MCLQREAVVWHEIKSIYSHSWNKTKRPYDNNIRCKAYILHTQTSALDKVNLFSVEKLPPAALGVSVPYSRCNYKGDDCTPPSSSHVSYLIESCPDTCLHPENMSKFQRLIRFEDPHGRVHYGELGARIVDDSGYEGLEVHTYEGSSPWSGDFHSTETKARIGKVRKQAKYALVENN